MNTLGILIQESLVHTLGWTLLHSLWQGLVIFIVYRTIIMLIHPSHIRSRYILSVAALSLIPLSAVITFAVLYPGQYVPSAVSSPVSQTDPITRTASALFISYTGDLIPGQLSIRTWYSSLLAFLNGHMDVIATGWIAGILFFLIRTTGGYYCAHRMRYRHVLDVGHNWEKRLEELRKRMGIRCNVRLAESLKTSVPSVIGFFKPVILVPAGVLTQIPADQLEAVLVHELAHILRKDYLVNLLQVVVEAFFFFHPVVWWLSGRIRTEREFICDDLALAYCQNPLIYIKALTSIQVSSQRPPLFAAALTSGKDQLLMRIKRMISPHTYKPINSGGSIMLLLTFTIVTVAASAALAIKSDPGQNVSKLLPGIGDIQPLLFKHSGTIAFYPGQASPYQKPGQEDGGTMTVIKDTTNRTDTAMADQERRSKEQYEKQLQQQELARERLQEAIKEHQEAIEQYRETCRQQYEFGMQQYKEALKEAEKKMQELYLEDSLDKKTLYFFFPPDGLKLPPDIYSPDGFYFDFGPDMHSFAWPDDSVFRKHPYFFTDSLPGRLYFFPDPLDPDSDLEDIRFKYPIPYDLKLPDIYYNYPDLEDLPEFKDLQLPDVPDLEEIYVIPYQHAIQKTETIMKGELLKDGIIINDGSYVVFIDSGMMSVNGAKQPREVFKKYKRLVETATGEGLKKGLTFFFFY